MFKWIKEILSYGSGQGYQEGSTILPELDTSLFAPMPEVKPPKTPDISEPVYILVANIIKYPHHWKFKTQKTWKEGANSYFTTNTIKDLVSGEIFIKLEKSAHLVPCYKEITYSENLSWANEEELFALSTALGDAFNKKKKRIDNIKQIKKDNERKRLMELYK